MIRKSVAGLPTPAYGRLSLTTAGLYVESGARTRQTDIRMDGRMGKTGRTDLLEWLHVSQLK